MLGNRSETVVFSPCKTVIWEDTIITNLKSDCVLLARTYVDDIDKLDGHNEPDVVNYTEDIYKYYKASLVTTIFLFSMSVESTHNCTSSLKMKYEHIANIT